MAVSRATKIYSKIFENENLANVGYTGKVQVKCPFHDDSEASAGVNPKDGFFHCFTCSTTHKNIDEFLSAYHGIPIAQARKLEEMLDENIDNLESVPDNMDFETKNEIADKLGVTHTTIENMKLFKTGRDKELFTMPVIINGVLLDYRSYAPGQPLKVKGAQGSKTGLIVGFDDWRKSKKKSTLIVAGEKDLLKARDQGFNAISITGGELALPRLFKGNFKGKDIVIFYDNDDAGKAGARSLAEFMYEAGAKSIRNITDHYEWMENKEDLFDFFDKYDKTRDDLIAIIKKTPVMTPSDFKEISKSTVPYMNLFHAKLGANRDKIIQSDVQVSSTFSSSWSIPKTADLLILEEDKEGKSNWNVVGTVEITGNNIHKILVLLDDEDKIKPQLIKMIKWKTKPYTLKGKGSFPHIFDIKEYYTVNRATVVDFVNDDVVSRTEDDADTGENEEIDLFTLENKLENGKPYNIHYKVVPHPKQKNKLVGIVLKTPTSAMNDVDDFTLTHQIKASLARFKNEGIEKLFKRFKGFAGNFITRDLYLAVELTFHSPLRFYYHNKIERGVIHSSIIGESRTGKSEAAQNAIKKYGLGKIVNAKLVTLVALLGGSTNKDGGWKITSGMIPRNNKSLIALEEIQGVDPEFHKKITEVKSSGRLRLARADGELNLESLVRLLEISNQKTFRGGTKKLETYANGIEVIQEIIRANEDIARQDFYVLIPEPKKYMRPDDLSNVLEPFDDEDYNNRALWVWSRKPNQIKFEDGVVDYIWTESVEINKVYNSHIKIFGSEAHKKIARVAIAFAGTLVSTDATFENIVVSKEHVDLATKWLIGLYDNDLFRLKEFVMEERSYSEVTNASLDILQRAFNKSPILVSQLEKVSSITRGELLAMTGQDPQTFNTVYSNLFKAKFIRLRGIDISPTEKFRRALKKIDQTIQEEASDLIVVKKNKENKTKEILNFDLEIGE